MNEACLREPGSGASAWAAAVHAAALFAVDPATGGVSLRAFPGPVRDAWMHLLRAFLPAAAPVRFLPLHATDDRLLGGLDLPATLQAGRRVAARGLLAEADGGVVLAAMAERMTPSTAATLAAALDTGEVRVERDGIALRGDARIGVVALDEGLTEEESPAAALLDRLAFHVDLGAIGLSDVKEVGIDPASVLAARAGLSLVIADEAVLQSLCGTALALGAQSLRAAWLALRAARAAAALAGRSTVAEEDAILAARLVLAPRATMLPPAEPPGPAEAESPPPPEHEAASPPAGKDPETRGQPGRPVDDIMLEAVQAAMPAGLLARLRAGHDQAARTRAVGTTGAKQLGRSRGRPIGARRGTPERGRVNVIETLRAAAPWQTLRRGRSDSAISRRVHIRPDDVRITRYRQRRATTTIFLVDASGSTAMHRMAEAKGAVELVLAECYIRRDRVALLAFRGRGAELLLPPTASLVRAKRALAGLPGGGGTPLAAGLDAARVLGDQIRRGGQTPVLVLLSDGRANVARDGRGGRAQAEEDALAAARAIRSAEIGCVLVDTSPRPSGEARRLAVALGGLYVPLPFAECRAVAHAIRETAAARHA